MTGAAAADIALSPAREPGAARLAAILLAGVALVAAGAMAGRQLFEQAALSEMRQSSAFAMAGNAAALQTKLQKFRLVPLALAADPELLAALRAPDEALRLSLNLRFEEIAAASDAAAIYLVDGAGVTFAASNFRTTQSFVGQDYSFRDYFRNALENREGEEFAIGTVSGEPGLYLSRRIDAPGGAPQGVIVVKLRFNDIEAAWADRKRLILATDRDGRIVVTSVEALRFARLAAPGAGVISAPPPTLAAAVNESFGGGAVLATVQPVDEAGWTVASFEALDASLSTPRLFGAVTGASLSALAIGAFALLLRRLARNARKAREIAAYRRRLELAVEDRTQALQSSYARLTEETGRRERAQDLLRVMQDEIALLNRLATLGQLSAKFAHEVNQPLAAMRNYIDNSAKLLAAGENDLVAQNLETMSGLVMRVARITGELRAFSRKRPSVAADVRIGRAIDGALLIAGPALGAASIEVARRGAADDALVRVDQVRIEQVVLNVIQNAIDALRDHPDPKVSINVAQDDRTVAVRIADNGRGVAAPETLFVPFQSDKENGLGLGLSISREILAEFGGAIVYRPGPDGGAIFEITLPRSGA